jgi:hypothetical protein
MGAAREILRWWVNKDTDDADDEDRVLVGDGAPHDWEFRLDPTGTMVALWNPDADRWKIFSNMVVLDEATVAQMDQQGWIPFLPVLEED